MHDDIKLVSIHELNRMLQSGGQVILLDVLPKSHYQQVHLPGARQACVFEVTFLQQVAKLAPDKSAAFVVYGASDMTHDAVTAADKLLRDGYIRVSVLAGGLAGWQEAGMLLEGEQPDGAARSTGQISNGVYPVDTAASVIAWAGRNPNSTHHGTLRLTAGEVQAAGGEIRGQFSIDMTSINNLNLAGDELQPVLEAHLQSDDFFFVRRFPEARFSMTARPTTSAGEVSSPNYQVKGELTLRGVSAEQSFPATIVTTDDGRLAAEAHFDIDRTRWGVIYGSTKYFEHLGMHLVFDQISLQLRILTK
ncbi:MAG TPA: YceI family protein [Geothermobacteraceae bacterium]|nr:YceI family protein [Geothermobacteraceae bacterium]